MELFRKFILFRGAARPLFSNIMKPLWGVCFEKKNDTEFIKDMLLLYPFPFSGLSKEMFWHLSWHQKILTEEIKLLIIDYRCFARKGGVFKSATQFSRKTAGQINQELFFAGPSVFRLGITNKYVFMWLDQSCGWTLTFSLFSTVEIGDMVCSGLEIKASYVKFMQFLILI